MPVNLESLQNAIKAAWWTFLLSGVVLGLIGLLLMLHPAKSVEVLVLFLGISWLVAGVLSVGSSLMGGSGWGWRLLGGILGFVAGIIVLANPVLSGLIAASTLVYILAFTFLFNGIAEMVMGRNVAGLGTQWSWGSFLTGLFHILIAAILFSNTLLSAVTLVTLVGVLCLIGGLGQVIFAFRVKSGIQRARASV